MRSGLPFLFKYYKKSVVANLGEKDVVENTISASIDKKVYCIKMIDGKLLLEPAPDQENIKANKCFKAVVYRIRGKYLQVRFSLRFLKRLGNPRRGWLYNEDGKLVIELENSF